MDSQTIKDRLKKEWEKKYSMEYFHIPYEDSIFVDLYEQMVIDAILQEPTNPVKYTTTTT